MDVGARLVAYDADGTRHAPRSRPGARSAAGSASTCAVGGPVGRGRSAAHGRATWSTSCSARCAVGGASRGSRAAAHRRRLRDRSDIAAITSPAACRSSSTAAPARPSATSGALLAEELRRRAAEPGRADCRDPGRHSRHRHRRLAVHHPGLAAAPSTCRRWTCVPVRNIPVVMPAFPWHEDDFAATR